MAITPELWKSGFTCPTCGVEAHQDWFDCYAKAGDQLRGALASASRSIASQHQPPPPTALSFGVASQNIHARATIPVGSLQLSKCHSCKAIAAWIGNRIVWPPMAQGIVPHVHMPAEIKVDFIEASSILRLSPRGAAALVRVALEKLINHLVGEPVKPNDGIQILVDKGMPVRVQKMCDAVRILANDSVHLGTIDANDDAASAIRLFHLVNVIVDQTIGLDKLADDVYGGLPHDKLQFIEDRARGAARKAEKNAVKSPDETNG